MGSASHRPEVGFEMLGLMLDALDFPVYSFDKNRTVLFANAFAREQQNPAAPGNSIGAAEERHFEHNQYFDEDGNLLDYPRESVIDRALRGEETRDLVLEHRNLKERTHQWISTSCTPVMAEDGTFSYGILWYRDVSKRKSREDKLRFLLDATKVLSLTTDFRKRLREKASLAVPSLADWCTIEILNPDGNIERVSLVHRDPKKIAFIKEYERKYPSPAEGTAARIIRTGKAEFIPRITDEMIDDAPGLLPEQRADVHNLRLSSFMAFPIGSPGKVLGVLTLAYAESGRVYTQDDFDFFEEFAHHLSVLLENARLDSEISARDLYKDLFLASLSHELRNPLAPIKTSLEILRLKETGPEIEDEFRVIEHQFDHLARLLNNLLDATRFVQGKIRIERERIDLGPVIAQTVQGLTPVAKEKRISLTVEGSGQPLMVSADRTRVEQALTNLVGNAIKFTPQDGRIAVTRLAEDGEAVVTVEDTGAGLTASELERVFEPYYQSERVRAGNSGLGIGLRLVYEIMQLHGGSIEARSEGPGLGSTFVMRLPLTDVLDETKK